MPRNGAGSYSLPNNSWFPAVNGVTATSTDWNNTAQDIQAAMTQSVSSDGQTPMTGDLPMGNNKIIGLAPGTANTDAANFSQTPGRLLNAVAFTATGTFTPQAATTAVIVEMVGGGGGGGGSRPTGAGQVSLGGGGGGGSYAKGRFTSGFSGVTVTVGTSGAGGGINTNGAAGGTSSFGALMTAPGGGGGPAGPGASSVVGVSGGIGGALGIGGNLVQTVGETPATIIMRFSDSQVAGMAGGSSALGMGPAPPFTNTNAAGNAASSWGCGGSGPATFASQGGTSGGAGRQGIVIIYEYA